MEKRARNSSFDWKRLPRSGNLSFGKRKKSTGAIWVEYGGYSMILVEFLARNSFTMIFSDSEHEILFSMQNLRQILC